VKLTALTSRVRIGRADITSSTLGDGAIGTDTYVDEDVVIDGPLVTGRGYGQNTEVLKAFIEMLNGH